MTSANDRLKESWYANELLDVNINLTHPEPTVSRASITMNKLVFSIV